MLRRSHTDTCGLKKGNNLFHRKWTRKINTLLWQRVTYDATRLNRVQIEESLTFTQTGNDNIPCQTFRVIWMRVYSTAVLVWYWLHWCFNSPCPSSWVNPHSLSVQVKFVRLLTYEGLNLCLCTPQEYISPRRHGILMYFPFGNSTNMENKKNYWDLDFAEHNYSEVI